MMGRVAGYEVDSKTGFWDISVELSEKMGNISKVYVVKNLKKLRFKKFKILYRQLLKEINDK
jgi:rod shape-determining protein MreC